MNHELEVHNEKTTWPDKTKRQKAVCIGIVLGIFFGAAFLAYAVSSYFTSKSFEIKNTKGTQFSIDLTGAVDGIAVISFPRRRN